MRIRGVLTSLWISMLVISLTSTLAQAQEESDFLGDLMSAEKVDQPEKIRNYDGGMDEQEIVVRPFLLVAPKSADQSMVNSADNN